jgi:hypothetical protein
MIEQGTRISEGIGSTGIASRKEERLRERKVG